MPFFLPLFSRSCPFKKIGSYGDQCFGSPVVPVLDIPIFIFKLLSVDTFVQILVTCLQRNYGLGDTHIHQELKAVRNGKNEYTMRVDKREVDVICKNKKDGKQLAAAKLLQQLHPHISSWGSLLRMYGNRSIRTLKKKKEKETEVTGEK